MVYLIEAPEIVSILRSASRRLVPPQLLDAYHEQRTSLDLDRNRALANLPISHSRDCGQQIDSQGLVSNLRNCLGGQEKRPVHEPIRCPEISERATQRVNIRCGLFIEEIDVTRRAHDPVPSDRVGTDEDELDLVDDQRIDEIAEISG